MSLAFVSRFRTPQPSNVSSLTILDQPGRAANPLSVLRTRGADSALPAELVSPISSARKAEHVKCIGPLACCVLNDANDDCIDHRPLAFDLSNFGRVSEDLAKTLAK
jgi:hypothetical protein